MPAGQWEPDRDYDFDLRNVADQAGNVAEWAGYLHFHTGTHTAAVLNLQPEWNAALNAIFFTSNCAGGFDIYRINPNGSGLQLVSQNPADESEPTVSADGQLLAWEQNDGIGGKWDIYVAPLGNPANSTPITPADANDTEPRFARTSSRSIVFISDRFGTEQLFRMGADGSGYSALSPNFGSLQRDPSPHPLVDNQILFTSNRAGSSDIWSMSVSAIDGTVTTINQTDTLSFNETQPDWSADASYFVFVSDESGVQNLWIGDLAGGRRQVTHSELPVVTPSTSPTPGSTQCAAVTVHSDGSTDIVIIDLVSGAIVRNLTSPEAGN
jgi:Tol biopolymer transport system component